MRPPQPPRAEEVEDRVPKGTCTGEKCQQNKHLGRVGALMDFQLPCSVSFPEQDPEEATNQQLSPCVCNGI